MARDMYQVECEPECGFMIRSHDRDEIADMTMRHANERHQEQFTRQDVEPMIERA